MREVHLMSEPRIVNIMEFLDRSSYEWQLYNLEFYIPQINQMHYRIGVV